jgi:hypothetical protein
MTYKKAVVVGIVAVLILLTSGCVALKANPPWDLPPNRTPSVGAPTVLRHPEPTPPIIQVASPSWPPNGTVSARPN